MSKTTGALLLKLAMTFIFAWLTIGLIDRNPAGWILLIAVVAAGVNYVVGDLMVLPKYGNAIAAAGDGIMGAVAAYILDLLIPAVRTGFGSLALFAVLVAVGEFFFHRYLLRSEEVAP